MKIAICDDSYQDALTLKSLFKGLHNTTIYLSAGEVLADIENNKKKYDLYLLDIYMEVMNGIDLAQRIRKWDENAMLCFISSSDAFYREAYDLYAVQYLIKPLEEADLNKLIERVSLQIARNRALSLQYKWRGQMGAIPYNRILFISSRGHMVYIQCKDGTVQECKGKLNEIAEQVCGDILFRCHQSFIVNMYYVSSLDGNELILSDYQIPISRRYIADIKKKYYEILFEEMD